LEISGYIEPDHTGSKIQHLWSPDLSGDLPPDLDFRLMDLAFNDGLWKCRTR